MSWWLNPFIAAGHISLSSQSQCAEEARRCTVLFSTLCMIRYVALRPEMQSLLVAMQNTITFM